MTPVFPMFRYAICLAMPAVTGLLLSGAGAAAHSLVDSPAALSSPSSRGSAHGHWRPTDPQAGRRWERPAPEAPMPFSPPPAYGYVVPPPAYGSSPPAPGYGAFGAAAKPAFPPGVFPYAESAPDSAPLSRWPEENRGRWHRYRRD